jgi:hypothetical protein
VYSRHFAPRSLTARFAHHENRRLLGSKMLAAGRRKFKFIIVQEAKASD